MNNKTNNYITVLTFTYSHEATGILGRLETEGIDCSIQDELTVQANPFYSNAIGGVKLKVRESDLERAIEILEEYGYINEDSYIKQSYIQKQLIKFISFLDKTTSKLPLLKKVSLGFRLFVIITIVLGLIGGVIYITTRPTTIERLTQNNWCIDNVTYNNENYIPQTQSMLKIIGGGNCVEGITFEKEGTVELPGFNSRSAIGEWGIYNDSLRISNVDTFGFVYNGSYQINLSRFGLVLKSATTTLDCQAENINYNVYIPY